MFEEEKVLNLILQSISTFPASRYKNTDGLFWSICSDEDGETLNNIKTNQHSPLISAPKPEDGEGVEENKEMFGEMSFSSHPLINLNISTGEMREELVSCCNFVCRLIFPAQNWSFKLVRDLYWSALNGVTGILSGSHCKPKIFQKYISLYLMQYWIIFCLRSSISRLNSNLIELVEL